MLSCNRSFSKVERRVVGEVKFEEGKREVKFEGGGKREVKKEGGGEEREREERRRREEGRRGCNGGERRRKRKRGGERKEGGERRVCNRVFGVLSLILFKHSKQRSFTCKRESS